MKASILLALALIASGGAQAQTAPVAPPAPVDCELHIWPTQNYRGRDSGGLVAFGLVGALIDHAAHKGKVATVRDLMREQLGPDAQVEELRKANVADTLGLTGYRIVVEPALPSDEAAKTDPAAKAQVKATQAKLRSGARLSTATTPCYAELIGTDIMYHKAALYGSNLFADWTFRDFGRDNAGKPRSFAGQIKNPLEAFPAKTPELTETAKVELRDAYAKDFAEYVQKKVRGAATVTAAR